MFIRDVVKRAIQPFTRPVWHRIWCGVAVRFANPIQEQLGAVEGRLGALEARVSQLETGLRQHARIAGIAVEDPPESQTPEVAMKFEDTAAGLISQAENCDEF